MAMDKPKYTTEDRVQFVRRTIAERQEIAKALREDARLTPNQAEYTALRQRAHEADTHADIQQNILDILFP